MPTIEGHHDFAALERRLAELISEQRPPGRSTQLHTVATEAPASRLRPARYGRTVDAARAVLADRAGWLRGAAAAVEGYSRRFRLVVHYGAYDLIGANLDLMRAVGAGAGRLVYLVPLHPTSRA